MSSINEHSFSDHKPKSIQLRLTLPWRHAGPARPQPQIRWEKLRIRETAEEYEQATQRAVEEARVPGSLGNGHTNWYALTDIMIRCVRELCGGKREET